MKSYKYKYKTPEKDEKTLPTIFLMAYVESAITWNPQLRGIRNYVESAITWNPQIREIRGQPKFLLAKYHKSL